MKQATSAALVSNELTDFFAAGGTQTIGALVFWSLSGVNIPREELARKFVDAGLGAAVPRDPRPTTLLTTAVEAVKVGKADLVMRRFGKGWAVQLETRDNEQGVLKYTQILTVQVTIAPTKDGLPLEWKGRGTPAQLARAAVVREEIEAQFRKARDFFDTGDLSAILVNLMHGTTRDTLLGAVSLRQTSGGLYFVHSKRLEDMRIVKETIERLAPKSTITVMTIMGNADNLAEAASAARRSFEAQLKELNEEVATFTKELGSDPAPDRSITVRADRYKQLAARVELFSDVLGTVAAELTSKIAQAEKDLLAGAGL